MAPTLTPMGNRFKRRRTNQSSSAGGPSDKSTDGKSTSDQKKTVQELAQFKKRKIASLLMLPNEVLESIFLQTDGINMALASPLLGISLSSRHTRLLATINAFRSVWEWSFGISVPRPLFLSLDCVDNSHVSQFASDIISQKWFTYDFFMDAMDKWAAGCRIWIRIGQNDGLLFCPKIPKIPGNHNGPNDGDEIYCLCPHLHIMDGMVDFKDRHGAVDGSYYFWLKKVRPRFSARLCINNNFLEAKAFFERYPTETNAPHDMLQIRNSPFCKRIPWKRSLFQIPPRMLMTAWNNPDQIRLVYALYRMRVFDGSEAIDWHPPMAPVFGAMSPSTVQKFVASTSGMPFVFLYYLFKEAFTNLGQDF